MKKKYVGVIGRGSWGKKIINELEKISNIKLIYRSKDNYKKFKENIDWIFILTPDSTHYNIAKYFLKKKINVFCEKPLAIKLKQAKDLISLSKRFKTNLYIDDIENYKKKIIKINDDKNYVIRKKKDNGSAKSLLKRLAYHDFYLLSKYISINKIKLIKAIAKKKILKFEIILKNDVIFNFYYDIGSNIKEHFINTTRLDKFTNNPIKDMLNSVLYKNNNFLINNKNAITCIKLIDKVGNILG